MIRALRLVWSDANLLMLSSASIIFGCFVSSVGIYQSLMAITVFDVPDTAYSAIIAASMVVSVVASVLVGILTDQKARRRTVAIGSALAMTTGAAILTIWPSQFHFVLVSVTLFPISGTLFGQFFALSRLAAATYERNDRDGILSVVRAAFALPFVIVLPIWGIVFDAGVPLMRIYPVVVIVSLGLAAMLWRYWPADGTSPWSGHRSGLSIAAALREMSTIPVLLRVALVGAIHVGSSVAGIIIGLLFNEASGRGAADVGVFFGVFVAVEVVVTLMIGNLLARMSRRTIIALGVIMYATFLALLPPLAPTPWLWLLTIPAGAGGAMIYTLAISYVQDLLGARAGAGAALLAIQKVTTESLSAVIFAIGTLIWGYDLVAYVAAVTIIGALVWLRWLDRNRVA